MSIKNSFNPIHKEKPVNACSSKQTQKQAISDDKVYRFAESRLKECQNNQNNIFSRSSSKEILQEDSEQEVSEEMKSNRSLNKSTSSAFIKSQQIQKEQYTILKDLKLEDF